MTKRMLRLAFSEADKQALHYERYHHPHPRVQQRMEALWLKSQGLPHHQIAHLCAISANTLRSYLKLYHTGGVEALKQLNFYCPQSLLHAHRDTIEAQVRAHPPQTINEDAAHFVFGAFLGYLWCFARCWIKAPSGRQRFNVLGALHAITYEVITVTNLTYLNAESVCQLLGKLAA